MQEYVPAISVTDPIGKAWERMMRICFRPFSMEKWFVMGFAAWLAHLGEGSMANYFRGLNEVVTRSGRGPPPNVDGIQQWISDNFWIVPVAGGAFLFSLVLGIFLLWVRARGSFILLEAVALNRTRIKEPWREYRPEGNSLFKFYLILYAAMMVLSLALVAGAGFLAWPSFKAHEFLPGAVMAILLFVFIGIPLGLVYAFIQVCAESFVVPILYARRQGVTAAWGACWREVLRPHFFIVILYFLMTILLGIGTGIAVSIFGLATCCIGLFLLLLPYISAVVTLPIAVLFRSYGVYFLAQISDEFKIFSEDFPAAPRGFPIVMQTPEDIKNSPEEPPPPPPNLPPPPDQPPPPG